MATVYLITSGRYSDYFIDAAFSTEEKARDFVEKSAVGGFRIEAYDLDTASPVLGYWSVVMCKAGDASACRYEENPDNGPPWVQVFSLANGDTSLVVTLPYGLEEDTALKTANDIRARLLALDRWEDGAYDYETLEPL